VRAAVRGPEGEVDLLQFRPDGRALISTSFERPIVEARRTVVWDLGESANLAVFCATALGPGSVKVAFGPDASSLVVTDDSGATRCWDLRTWQEQPLVEGGGSLTGRDGPVSSVAIGPGGRYAAGLVSDGVRLWDRTGAGPPLLLETPAPSHVTFSADGRTLAAAGPEGTVSLWEVTTGRQLGTIRDAPPRTSHLGFTPDGQSLVLTGSQGSSFIVQQAVVGVWDVASRQKRAGSVIENGVVGADNRFAAAYEKGVVRLWDLSAGREVGHYAIDAGKVGVALGPEGRTLATGGDAAPLQVWDLETGKVRELLAGTGRPVAFSPDGRLLTTVEEDGTVRVWKVRPPRSP
jgi:WD40 repeat protein